MKAIVQDRYGPADVLDLREVPLPEVGDREVLVRVVAAGIDRGAWHFMTGQPYLMRVIGFGLRRPKVPVAGTNIAGYVEAAGPGATAFSIGDEVYGTARGAFAEYARTSEDKIAPKPKELSFDEAAALPYAGFAALQGLREHGRLRAGEHVLIVGASGAVGSAAVQLARAMGAHVTGVCSTASEPFVRKLGADAVIDYRRTGLGGVRPQWDLVLDIGGRTPLRTLRRALKRGGRLVIVGGEGGRWTGVGRQVLATMISPFVSQRMGTFVAKENRALLEDLSGYVAAGQLRPHVWRDFPMLEAADAMRALDTPHPPGRIVLTI